MVRVVEYLSGIKRILMETIAILTSEFYTL